MGTTIAFELVKLLESKFKSIQLIVVDRPVTTKLIKLRKQLQNTKNEEELFNQYKAMINLDEQDEEQLKLFLKNNIQLLSEHEQFGKINSDIIVFEAKDNQPKTNMADWKKYTKGDFTINFIQGTRWQALDKKNLVKFETVLKSIVEKLEK